MGTMTAALARATDRVYSAFGAAASYTDRNGVVTPCTVLEEQDLARYGETAQVNVKTAVLSVRVAEVAGAPRSGEHFAVTGGATYRVDSLQGSDALEHRVFVA